MDWKGIQVDFIGIWQAIVLWNLAYTLRQLEGVCERHGW